MRKQYRLQKGISVITLMFTIIVIVILISIMMPSGKDKIKQAQLATLNHNITGVIGEIQSYMIMNNQKFPALKDSNGNYIEYSVKSNPKLLEQVTKWNDQNDPFYIVDINKLKLDNKDIGVGKTIDDYYIIASKSYDVYYAKGVTIDDKVYYTKTDTPIIIDVAKAPTLTPTPTPAPTFTPTPTNTPTPTPTVTPTPTNTPTPTPTPGAFDGFVNGPKLAAGMTAVKWDGSSWVSANTLNTNNDWYDYHNTANKWANAKLADGSLLVWIPRFTYQIASGEHTSTAGTINIRFSNGTTDDTSSGYRVHPAFYWGGWNIPISAAMTKQAGGTELTGFWIGKFEASNNGNGKVKIVPNVTSWRSINVNTIFNLCLNINADNATYGLTSATDTHMTKQSEWGAAAYLSKYALGSVEIATNANASYITADGSIVTYKNESTTGNEYGVFDMSGGAYEYVASYVNNGNSNLSTYGNSLYTAAAKYKDVLPAATTESLTNNYEASSQAYGYAIYETSSTTASGTGYGWFGDYSYYANGVYPFFYRSGNYNNGTHTGPYCFNADTGDVFTYCSFRVSAVVP